MNDELKVRHRALIELGNFVANYRQSVHSSLVAGGVLTDEQRAQGRVYLRLSQILQSEIKAFAALDDER